MRIRFTLYCEPHTRYLLPIKRQALDQEPLSNYQAPSTAWNDWEMGITTTLQRKQTDGCSYPYKGGNSSILKATFFKQLFSFTKIIGLLYDQELQQNTNKFSWSCMCTPLHSEQLFGQM